ncbi:MAG: hypothetical protein NVS3B10_23870 [Polyangiales bacterium]
MTNQPSAEQLDIPALIAAAGGRTAVARALGVTYFTVRAWSRGEAQPHANRLAALRSMPPAPPLRVGRPRNVRVADPEVLDRVVALAGSIRAAAGALAVSVPSVERYRAGRVEMPERVAQRARAYVATATLSGQVERT